jgi:hypothetical protein
MATTTNFGWETPDDTDLVKDGALAIRTLGSAIDTSLVDLKGGTTGQILSKASNTDLDYTWINNDQGDITAVTAGTGISGGGTSGTVTITNSMATEITAAGDIIVGTGSGTFDNLPIGTTGQILTADTTVSPYKVKWATPAASSSGMTLVTTGSFSGNNATSINDCFSSTYENYLLLCETNPTVSGASNLDFRFRVSGADNTTTNYNLTYLDVGSSPLSGTSTAQTSARVGNLGSTGNECRFVTHIFNPYASKQKAIFSTYNRLGLGTGINGGMVWAGFAATTSFTGITLYASGSATTFTGTYYIYGLAKS